jgi:hypothetical protein
LGAQIEQFLRMRFHSHWLGVAASSRDNSIEKKERLSNCQCFRVDMLMHLATAAVFNGDLQDSNVVVKEHTACRPRPPLCRNAQLLHTLFGLVIDIVTDNYG